MVKVTGSLGVSPTALIATTRYLNAARDSIAVNENVSVVVPCQILVVA